MKILGKNLTWLQISYLCLCLSIFAVLATLFYSEIMRLSICPLCWYQRIAMYPLVVIFGVGILLTDRRCFYYAMPLILIGFVIALYQVLLQAGIVPNLLEGCKFLNAVPCAEVNFRLFGFLTVPQQGLIGFGVLGFLAWLGVRAKDDQLPTRS